MGLRSRKLVGVLATVAVLIIYSLLAMVVGVRLLVDTPVWVQLPGFIVLGIGIHTLLSQLDKNIVTTVSNHNPHH